MGDVPSAEEVRAALEDLDSDARFWFQSSDVLNSARATAEGLSLGEFELGLPAVEFGVLSAYDEVKDFVVKSLRDGSVEMERLALALRDAIDKIDGADRESGAEIRDARPGAGGSSAGGSLGEAAGSVIRDLPGR